MNTRENMVIINNRIRTSDVLSCEYNKATGKMDIEYKDGSKESYGCEKVEWISNPKVINPEFYRISRGEMVFFDVEKIYEFAGKNNVYWHICFKNDKENDYLRSELKIIESCLTKKHSANVLEYIKQVAELSELCNEKKERILPKRFQKLSFVGENVALAKYLNAGATVSKQGGGREYTPIFPFGCNSSQYKAVKRAMENQISVIQGPPGTGKTQTILNIIANILMEGKTVQVVSNNNSATLNVYEKLASPKYNLGFLVAKLGCEDNKKLFVQEQDGNYPDFSTWKSKRGEEVSYQRVYSKSRELQNVFKIQERLAELRQEQLQLGTEQTHFKQYADESGVNVDTAITRKKLTEEQWVALWMECQDYVERKGRIPFWVKIRNLFRYRIYGFSFYNQEISKIVIALQYMFYVTRQNSLSEEISKQEKKLEKFGVKPVDELSELSMRMLKDKLARKYGAKKQRRIFSMDELWKNSSEVLKEYPIVLSTTFSSRSSLNKETIYDYLIMDEASQVDVATGALALSCAKNVIIVGDTKQLPNVVKGKDRVKAKTIFERFHIHSGYQFTNSFLQSVLEVMPGVTQTMLKEHYRCHPKIINFCNQKFYKNELIIMTEDKGEKDVLTAIKTVPGNHARAHYSQRQIDIIKKEIIPKYVIDAEETGIIAPYRDQVEALEKEFEDIGAATVHKFQGKEKDTIIISTVDDIISDFADDSYLINVAVSRAKKKLMLVVTGNKQQKERNILDLVDYIQYSNFEVIESKIRSIFDYLYKQYEKERKEYLMKKSRISEYDSENLMHGLLEEILEAEKYSSFDVRCHVSLNELIKEVDLLNEREQRYVKHPKAHVDFLIYNRISKKPVLAIEVDGYAFHKPGTMQAERDLHKDHIFEVYGLPLLRLKTNGSEEKEKVEKKLEEMMGERL